MSMVSLNWKFYDFQSRFQFRPFHLELRDVFFRKTVSHNTFELLCHNLLEEGVTKRKVDCFVNEHDLADVM